MKKEKKNGKLTMPELPEQERPYEKCSSFGPQALDDAELMAVILRTGARGKTSVELAREILSHGGPDYGLTGIFHLSAKELQEIPGIGEVKALQVLCIAELARRIARTSARTKLNFNDPDTIADYYMERLRHEEQELVFCMMLDTRNGFLGESLITRGTVNSSLLSPREIFLKAFSFHAVHIILVHNHPSGDPTPSDLDIQITIRIQQAGKLLGINLLDHIIIGDRCFVSLKDEVLLPESGGQQKITVRD